MDEINKINLSEQTRFQLDEISKIEKYFIEEINQRKSCSQKLSILILVVLGATTRGVSIISFTSVIGAPVGIVSAIFTLVFCLTAGIVKKLLDITTTTKKKKHDKILMLAKSKLNSNGTLISQALIDTDISYEEFITILKEKDRYEMMKENLRNKNGESFEIMRFNSVKSKT